MTRRSNCWTVIILSAIQFACNQRAFPGQVVVHADPSSSLSSRWDWARQEASRRAFPDGYWTGYFIKRLMGKNSFIGSFSSDVRKNRRTLGAMIDSADTDVADIPYLHEHQGKFEGFITDEDDHEQVRLLKNVAILFHFSPSHAIDEATISNLSLHVDLHGDPLIWIGEANDDESLDLLASTYRASSGGDIKKKIITAVGIHPPTEKAFQFLKSILLGSDVSDIRGETAYWIGQNGFSQALELLQQTALDDHSVDAREKALFAIHEMGTRAATASIIRIAREGKDRETRTKAVFWLGQEASASVAQSLRHIAYADEDTEVQKSALFALTQLPDDEGINELIDVATTHTNPTVRKEAIFLLSQSENPRALEALIAIAQQ